MTLDLGAYKGTVSNQCAPTDNVEVNFQVNMFLPRISGAFNPSTEQVRLAGDFTGWTASTAKRLNLGTTSDVYEGIHQFTGIKLGVAQQKFKFIVVAADTVKIWEGGADKSLTLPTSGLVDSDNNGFKNYTWGNGYYFDNTGADPCSNYFCSTQTICQLELDARPAYYHLADKGNIPTVVPPNATNLNQITGFYINGALGKAPAAYNPAPWVIPQMDRQLIDNGMNGDAVASDSIFTTQYTFPAGASRTYSGKFSVNGYNNVTEANGNVSVTFPSVGNCKVRKVLGAFDLVDGRMSDNMYISSSGAWEYGPYDDYILINNLLIVGATMNPKYTATASVVRRGGNVDGKYVAVEQIDTEIPQKAHLGAAYPNPFQDKTQFDYAIPAADEISIKLYDALGRLVTVLQEQSAQTAGTYQVKLDAQHLPSGVYFYVLEGKQFRLSNRLTVIR